MKNIYFHFVMKFMGKPRNRILFNFNLKNTRFKYIYRETTSLPRFFLGNGEYALYE